MTYAFYLPSAMSSSHTASLPVLHVLQAIKNTEYKHTIVGIGFVASTLQKSLCVQPVLLIVTVVLN